jgi:hypothetical protein
LYEAFKSRRGYLATLGLVNVRNLAMERRVPAPAALVRPPLEQRWWLVEAYHVADKPSNGLDLE